MTISLTPTKWSILLALLICGMSRISQNGVASSQVPCEQPTCLTSSQAKSDYKRNTRPTEKHPLSRGQNSDVSESKPIAGVGRFRPSLICGPLAQNGSRDGVNDSALSPVWTLRNATRHGEVASKAHENVAGAALPMFTINYKLSTMEALALPNDPLREFQMLKAFLARYDVLPQGYDIILVNDQERLIGNEYSITSTVYKGLRIWLRRSA